MSTAPPDQTRGLDTTQRSLLIVGVVIVALFLAGWVGYDVHAATHPAQQVRVVRTFDGTVSFLNDRADAGCVKPDGGKPVCSGILSDAGSRLRVGERVHAAHAWISTSRDSSYDTLIIYPTDPGAVH